MIVITHKLTNDQGTILELKDNRDVIYTWQQIIKKLKKGIPIKLQSGMVLTAKDTKEDNFNELPPFYYRDQSIRPCDYL